MKKIKVLFIAYHFPPKLTAGTFRTIRYLNNLNCFDIDAVVLTSDESKTDCEKSIISDNYKGFPVYRVKEWNVKPIWYYPAALSCVYNKFVGKSYDLYSKSFHFIFIDHEWGWVLPAYFKAIEIVKKHDIDVIYVSSPPNSSAYLGYKLKQKIKKPFLLDLRDYWNVTNFNIQNNIVSKYSKLEYRILKLLDGLIVTSETDKKNYSRVINPEKVHLIYNGYDELYSNKAINENKDNLFKLVYLGNWELPFRSPRNILMALRECSFPWQLISIGSSNEILLKLVNKLGLKEHVYTVPSQPKDKLVSYMKEATAFFLIQGEFEPGQPNPAIASKTMDYLATGKPIFAQLPEGDNREFLKRYGKEVYIADHKDYNELRNILNTFHKKRDSYRKSISENREFLLNFKGKVLTEQLAGIIRGVYDEKY